MKINNQFALQSYVMTTAKYDFSTYEKRILYRIVEILQDIEEINEFKKNKNIPYKYEVHSDLFGGKYFTVPIKIFQKTDSDKNHTKVKEALAALRNKAFEYEDSEIWEYLGIIEEPKIKLNSGIVSFKVTPRLYDAFLNFSKGFRLVEIETAMNFNSTYAMRFYELVNNQSNVITHSINNLKEMFKVVDKYKNNSDFIKHVVEKARLELDEKSPYSFKYKIHKYGRKIESVSIIPINKNKKISKENLNKINKELYPISTEFFYYMKFSIHMNDNEINNNRELIHKAELKIPNLEAFFNEERQNKILSAKNVKGYFIQVLKSVIDER